MATHSSILGLPCGSAGTEYIRNVGDLGLIPGLGRPGFSWRRERLPTPVFQLGEFHGLHSPWGRRESDTTEQLSLSLHFTSVQSLSHVQLFVTPWTAARQASLSSTNSWSLLKLMFIELVMPSNHLIVCRTLPLPPSIFPSISLFQ